MEKQENKWTNYIPSEILHFILFREKKITFYSYFIHFISVINDTWSVAKPKKWAELLGFYVNHMFRSY